METLTKYKDMDIFVGIFTFKGSPTNRLNMSTFDFSGCANNT